MAIGLGAEACVRKPFTPAQLMHAVQTCDVARACKVA
jgi:CheY-like chemotaxis protein